MIWTVEFAKDAKKRLLMLPKNERERILGSVDKLSHSPYRKDIDVKKLKGCAEWRLRVGGWRVIFEVYREKITINIISIDPRGYAEFTKEVEMELAAERAQSRTATPVPRVSVSRHAVA